MEREDNMIPTSGLLTNHFISTLQTVGKYCSASDSFKRKRPSCQSLCWNKLLRFFLDGSCSKKSLYKKCPQFASSRVSGGEEVVVRAGQPLLRCGGGWGGPQSEARMGERRELIWGLVLPSPWTSLSAAGRFSASPPGFPTRNFYIKDCFHSGEQS